MTVHLTVIQNTGDHTAVQYFFRSFFRQPSKAKTFRDISRHVSAHITFLVHFQQSNAIVLIKMGTMTDSFPNYPRANRTIFSQT
jgi:hypothetical protein